MPETIKGMRRLAGETAQYVCMIEERLQNGWPKSGQPPRELPQHAQTVMRLCAEANDHDAGVAKNARKLALSGKAEDEWLEAPAVQAGHNLDKARSAPPASRSVIQKAIRIGVWAVTSNLSTGDGVASLTNG